MEIEGKFTIELKHRERHSKINKIRGNYNEYLAMKHFSRMGYTVIPLVYPTPTGPTLISNKSSETITTISYDYVKNIERLEYLAFHGHSKLLEYLKETYIGGLPDLLCIKENSGRLLEIIFVECKCDPKKLNKNQIKRFTELKSMGYPVYIFSTNMKKIKIEHGETSIKRFKKD